MVRTQPAEHRRCFFLASPLGEMNRKKGFLLLEVFGSSCTSLCAKMHEFLRDTEEMQIYMTSQSSQNEESGDPGKPLVQNDGLS